ncbi:uncharacterized protein LOC114359636 [Ostrinia furnacalis]|uniref:uncharacterized protein LOC114359636 n=1 Tax=Ostrinia furnacalis TaxID=93504 RepID=UPI0010398A27|nr:uncharacterized protein LOC114359636 [Ostrinia furnacalis]
MASETATAELDLVKEDFSTGEELPTDEKPKEYVLSKTLRSLLNLLTHVLMIITVFICLVFACKSHIGIYELHIISGVIGYQFFMCQGILVLAKYNAWSIYLRRLHRIHIHWVLELVAVALVTAGGVFFILELPAHFTTLHGSFGLVALGATLLSTFLGIVAGISYMAKACAPARRWFKYIHHAISVIALLLASVSLCLAYDNPTFKIWTSRWFENDEFPVPIIMLITLLFTCLVAFEFVIALIWV